jgi:hypothetical protein
MNTSVQNYPLTSFGDEPNSILDVTAQPILLQIINPGYSGESK